MTFEIHTNPAEFLKFHELLVKNAPEGYEPFYFALVPNTKDPIKEGKYDPILAGSWFKRKLSVDRAHTLLEKGYNIAIAALANDPLCIVDVDNIELVGSIKSTLVAQSRKRIGRHNFFFTSDESTYKKEDAVFIDSAKDNIDTDIAGEVRANNGYVVCAGSFVECSEKEILKIPEEDRVNAGKYTIFAENDVSYITYEELPDIYKQKHEQEKLSEIEYQIGKEESYTNENEENSKYKSNLWTLTIQGLTGIKNNSAKRFPMFSDFHDDDSKTGGNASISGDLLHCWRHHVSHNAFTFLAVKAGLYTCNDAGRKFKGHRFGATKTPENVYKIWLYAKQKGVIPDNDPAPSKALEYAAISLFKLCSKADLTDGWKLPADIYNKTLDLIEASGINPGREPLEKKENSPVEEITQEEINKIRADRYSPRIPNLHNVLDEHHLINVYCDWISSLSDTYYEYQVGSVFWLLSALTQGKVCLRAKQEIIKPNLWSFFLGRSTTSRKSTAINKVKDIFTSATDSELFNDEFSIEGYLKLLSKYPVNNIVRDEAGGLLAKSYKKYNDGIFDIECLVYDGQGVRKTLAKEEVTIINPFVTHLYGTTLDTFTSVMQLRTVLGGYGFRFLYFAPDYIKPRKDIDMETEEDIEKWAEILTRVKKLKKFFDNSDVINFKVEPGAFKNYNQVIANLETTIDNIGDSMLNSALGRYQVYILKLAMLIEIGKPEPSFTIHKDSMNLAISLVVDYFLPSYQDIVERLEEDIKFNQIEKVVSTLRKLGNTAPRHKLLKNSKIKQKDFDEVISTLVASKTLTIKTITGTGGSDGEVFILEDVKLDLRSAFCQRPSFPSFTYFPSFTHVTNNYTNAVKEVKEAKTNIECASRLCFTSDMGEIGERRERSETSKFTETEEIEKCREHNLELQSVIKTPESLVDMFREEGF